MKPLKNKGEEETLRVIRMAHYPHAHEKHNKQIPCGCIFHTTKCNEFAICGKCGAVYDNMSVMTFNRFRCYDCETYPDFLICNSMNSELRKVLFRPEVSHDQED